MLSLVIFIRSLCSQWSRGLMQKDQPQGGHFPLRESSPHACSLCGEFVGRGKRPVASGYLSVSIVPD